MLSPPVGPLISVSLPAVSGVRFRMTDKMSPKYIRSSSNELNNLNRITQTESISKLQLEYYFKNLNKAEKLLLT